MTEKQKQIILYSLCGVAAIVFMLAGFWINKVTQRTPPEVSSLEQDVESPMASDASFTEDTMSEINVTDTEEEIGQLIGQGTIRDEIMPQSGAEEDVEASNVTQPSTFLLRRNEDTLSVYQDGVAVVHLIMPSSIPDETAALLDEGVPFESLEEIECWLESFDS